MSFDMLCTCLEFKWHDGASVKYLRLTNANQSVLYQSEVFTPHVFEVKPAQMTGTATENPWQIDLTNDLYPFSKLALGYPFAPINCRILALDTTDPDKTAVPKFNGRVGEKPRVNPSNRAGLIRISLFGTKSLLSLHTLGAAAQPECLIAEFGDERCRFELSRVTYTDVTIEASPHGNILRRVQVSSPSLPTFDPEAWINGTLIINGMSLPIDNAKSDGRLTLGVNADPAWEGQSCVLVEGCSRKLSRCLALNNHESFSGIGRKMKAHNPAFYG